MILRHSSHNFVALSSAGARWPVAGKITEAEYHELDDESSKWFWMDSRNYRMGNKTYMQSLAYIRPVPPPCICAASRQPNPRAQNLIILFIGLKREVLAAVFIDRTAVQRRHASRVGPAPSACLQLALYVPGDDVLSCDSGLDTGEKA